MTGKPFRIETRNTILPMLRMVRDDNNEKRETTNQKRETRNAILPMLRMVRDDRETVQNKNEKRDPSNASHCSG
jgi:hypothetical protein